MTEAASELRERGYAFLEGWATPDRTEALGRVVDRCLADDAARFGRAELIAAGQWGALRNLCDLDPAFVDLLADVAALPLFHAALGPELLLHSYDALVLFPGDGRFPWDFHTDVQDLAGATFPAPPAVNSLLFLDDGTPDNGAPWLLPESHRRPAPAGDPDALARASVQATARRGTLLLFDARLWHCAGHNRSAAPRRLVKTMLCRPWLRPQMDYFRALSDARRAAVPARVRRILGEGLAPPASVPELRRRLAGGS